MEMVQVQMVEVPEAEEWALAEEVINRDITKTTNLTTTEDCSKDSLAGYLEWVEDMVKEWGEEEELEWAMEEEKVEEEEAGKCPDTDMEEDTGDMD